MKWINTQELISILKRFPNSQVEVSVYLGCSLASSHLWMYSTEENRFLHTIGSNIKSYSEVELFRLYNSQHWKIKSFFFLRNDHEKQIAFRLIEELGIFGRLEDIITESELDNVRICEHCHHLMDEGWLVEDSRTFCSDECLQSAYSNINISELKTYSLDVKCWAYWTKWED